MNEFLTDANGNTASAEYFGSRKAAEEALYSLRNCSNCSDCLRCSDCEGCSDCEDCSDCLRCSDCSYCSYCSDCSNCSGCSDCEDCSDCSNCVDCSYCSGCSNCSDCLYCSDCSNCSGCSDCVDCSDCLRCSNCSGAKPAKSIPSIPKIPEIHKSVYEAASQPKALDMLFFHTCETTHCRAGWVVTLAGSAGKALEDFFNTELAAVLIYLESGYKINPARFYDTNEAALADMKRLAEAEEAATK